MHKTIRAQEVGLAQYVYMYVSKKLNEDMKLKK